MPLFARIPMLFRFSAYGFLKNQQYFEPFLILVFREKGLSFATIGFLIGFREVCINLLEIPSGAVADLYGRRRSMILSFAAYIVSFLIFATASAVWMLFGAMACFAVGEAFRTGTHKAMIFDWLARNGLENEKTRYYGFTRSWSKYGSAFSALIAAGLVFWTGRYATVFWFCTIPYAFNILNFLGYPKYLDGETQDELSLGRTMRLTFGALGTSLRHRALRRLLLESMTFEGIFKVTKDYLQPVLKQLALALPILAALPLIGRDEDPARRSAVLVGLVYSLQYVAMGWASRHADAVCRQAGGEERAIRWVWRFSLALFVAMGALLWTDQAAAAVVTFIVLGFAQNIFRPTQISRFGAHAPPAQSATILSIESQSKSVVAMVLAPLVGWAVDVGLGAGVSGVRPFWPVAVVGAMGAAAILAVTRSRLADGDGSKT